jgi:hypothetical protein
MIATKTELLEYPELPHTLANAPDILNQPFSATSTNLCHAGSHVSWHNNPAGTATVTLCEKGCEVWDLVIWRPEMQPSTMKTEIMRLCREQLVHPDPKSTYVISLCLMPGDIL